MSPAVLVDLPDDSPRDALRVLPVIETWGLNLYYGDFHALKNITLPIPPKTITAFIGPSGCGKSTLLRTFNRMNDLIRGVRVQGEVLLDGKNILSPGTDLIALRKRVGMVFQRPNPFPISVFENVAYGPRVHHAVGNPSLGEIVEQSLRATGLWDEVKDKLNSPALALSPEQQQRLCISRLLAVEPDVLLMDEPCSALDPIATQRIEEMILDLQEPLFHRHRHPQHATSRPGVRHDRLFFLGELVEFGPTGRIFTSPQDTRTEQYITGRFG
jgi:phosphate transport system ATP-binding protein